MQGRVRLGSCWLRWVRWPVDGAGVIASKDTHRVSLRFGPDVSGHGVQGLPFLT